MTHAPRSASRRTLSLLIAIAVIGAAAIAAWFFLRHASQNPLSEDAVIQADVVHISAAVPGLLTELMVREGDRVKRGDVLFRLDPQAYALQLQQAEAQRDIAQAALTTRDRQIQAETANAAIADEQIARAQTNLALAQRTAERLKPLAAKGYVPQQQLDTALTAERDARVSLTQAQSQAQAAQHLIGQPDGTQAALRGAQATVALARKALEDTEVRAPHDGLVVGLRVSAGERLAPGQSLFTLINAEQWFAQAFFLETELDAIQAGACASVYVLADPSHDIAGKVVGIGWGVSSEEMISLPRALPYVQKSLNWVRVAQRFPVRIQLDAPPDRLMRMGASASVVVRPDRTC